MNNKMNNKIPQENVLTKEPLLISLLHEEGKQISNLHESILLLHDRLIPVMNVDQIQDAETNVVPPGFPVPMGNEIVLQMAKLRMCHDVVSEILKKLEI